MPRNDPKDHGGMFIGRRPGTAPLRLRAEPGAGSTRAQRRFDGTLAGAILTLEVLVGISLWGPQPMAWLWVGSRVDYWTGSVSIGILSAFAGMMATLLLTLSVIKRLDYAWQVIRRAAGHAQREGMVERIFVISAAIGVPAFLIWLFLIEGPGSNVIPQRYA